MPDTRELDTRIRELVARAVADAPPAPELDPVIELRRDHRPWWIGGGIAVATAAAAVTVFTFGDQDDKIATVPATQPTVATVPESAPARTAPGTDAPPATSVPPAARVASGVVTAGSDGVRRWLGGPIQVTSEPMAFAIDLGDGRVLAQRYAGAVHPGVHEYTDADTAPVVIAPDGTISPLFDTADWDGGVTVHDVEVVEGRPLLLFSLSVGMDRPDTANETLYVVDLETADRTEIAQVGGWESDTGRLHLATTGLIVGEWHSGPSHGIALHTIGDDTEPLTPADLGLPPDGYGDCSNCPRSFTITPDGSAVAWVDPADDFSSYEFVVHPLDGGDERRTTVHPDVPANLVDDLDAGVDTLLISFRDGGTGDIPAPVLYPADNPAARPTVLSGEVATIGPSAG